MLNIEKYKDEILNEYQRLMSKNTPYYMDGTRMNKAIQTIAFKHCGKVLRGTSITFRWLFEEYKEPVLDNVERKYLSDAIRPFRHRVESIAKCTNSGMYQIVIYFKDTKTWWFPLFPRESSMYKGMQTFKYYSLKELGL